MIHRTRVSITKNRSNIKAFFPACSSSLSTFHHPATSCQREIWSCVIKEFAAWRYVMSTVTSRNGARPADNGRPFISFLDVPHRKKTSRGLYRASRVSPFPRAKWHLRERLFDVESRSILIPFSLLSFPRRKYRRCGGVKEHLRGKHIRSFTVFIDGERNSRSRRIDIDSHFSWIGKRRLQNGWMLFIYSCRNRRFILRLDKKIKNLILIIFRSLRFLFSVFCGFAWFMILRNIHSKRK